MTDTHSRPFEKFLDEWSELLAKRLEQAHRHVAGQISAQILPQGVWQFPMQALLLPQSPAWQQITSSHTSPAATPLVRRRKTTFEDEREPWTPCGSGWIRTLATQNCGVNGNVCRWTLQHTPGAEEPDLFDPQQGLLVCIAAEEAAVAMLSTAAWRAQINGRACGVQVERYEGYCELEQALRLSAPTTPALETWLPPFYPYSRKILHLRFSPDSLDSSGASGASGSKPSPFAAFAAPSQEAGRQGEAAQIALSVTVEEEIGVLLRERLENGDDWLLLNPVVAAQMKMDWQPTRRDILMGKIELVFDDLKGVFAAAGVSAEAWEAAPLRHEGSKTRVACGGKAQEARVYFGSRGVIDPAEFEDREPEARRKRREILSDPDNQRETMPSKFEISQFPVGGLTLDFSDPTGDACRFWWQWLFLRSRMLTFGELQEFLRHLPDCNRCFDIKRAQFRLEGVNSRVQEPTLWDSYLWPSRMAEPFLSYQPAFRPPVASEDASEPEEPAQAMPISPVMRLTLPVRAGVTLPDFLLKDMAHHAASCLEQSFSLGWYRIMAEIER